MSIISDARRSVKDKLQSPKLVRFRNCAVTDRDVFEQGCAYLLPAGQADEFMRAGFVVEVTDESDRAAALQEIRVRNL